jgi:hypothetical protein
VIFGLWHAAWLGLLFALLIMYRKDALLIILGVFGGLMYNFIVPAGQWFYPWDMPTMFFFTWACLLYDKRQLFPLLVVVWVGSLFKETVMCCTLLVLLGEHWPWRKRISGFAATTIAFLLTRKLLMVSCGVETSFSTVSTYDPWALLVDNMYHLFSFNPNHGLFINAGALLAMMMIPWRSRRDVIFKVFAMAFIAGQFLCGSICEFRDWYELLPLGWMVISEALPRGYPIPQRSLGGPVRLAGEGAELEIQAAAGVLTSNATRSMSEADLALDNRLGRVMKGGYWLMMAGLLSSAIVVLVVGRPIHEKQSPTQGASAYRELGLQLAREGNLGEAIASFNRAIELGRDPQAYYNLALAYVALGRQAEAIPQYRKALELKPDLLVALNDLAWILATHPQAELRNGAEAVRLAEKACQLAGDKEPRYWGTLDAAYAEAGRFGDAIVTARTTHGLAKAAGQSNVANAARERIELYRAKQPFRQP